jgi:predicted transposase/invertase (TIGR01784 family)
MFPLEENRKVVTIEYDVDELIPTIGDFRHSSLNVLCTDNFDRQFIVKMQMNWTANFKPRMLLNDSKVYVRQHGEKEKYKLLYPVYVINFVYDVYEESPKMKDEYYHHYKTAYILNTEERIEGLEFIFIEMPKFKPGVSTMRKYHELWLRFLTEINELIDEAPSELLSDKLICEALHYTENGRYNRNELFVYDEIRMFAMDERSALSDFEEKGIEKGRAERLAKVRAEIAINALKKGMSPEDVSELTGLSFNEIHKLNAEF